MLGARFPNLDYYTCRRETLVHCLFHVIWFLSRKALGQNCSPHRRKGWNIRQVKEVSQLPTTISANSIILRKRKATAFSRIECLGHRKEYFSYALNLSDLLSLVTLVCWWGNWGLDKLRVLPQVKSLHGSRRTQKEPWLNDSQLTVLLTHIIM